MRSSVDNITPGPWHVEEALDELGEGEGFFHVCHPGTQCESTVVATVSDLEADVATLKANAYLIASARELYEAGNSLHAHLNTMQVSYRDRKLRDLLEAMAYAIAKANGELPND